MRTKTTKTRKTTSKSIFRSDETHAKVVGMPKHFFFDLDKTLTMSRSPMAPEHVEHFRELCAKYDVIVVTGGREEQILTQVPFAPKGHYYMLSQQGNYAVSRDGALLWKEVITPEQEKHVLAFVELLKKEHAVVPRDPSDIVENRGSLYGYSPIGFHASIEEKYAFDPDSSKRLTALAKLSKERIALSEAGIDVMPAGTTTYDFILAGRNKGYNIVRLIEYLRWKRDDSIYVGDEIAPGKNDESVIGVIPTKPVTDPEETFKYVEHVLK